MCSRSSGQHCRLTLARILAPWVLITRETCWLISHCLSSAQGAGSQQLQPMQHTAGPCFDLQYNRSHHARSPITCILIPATLPPWFLATEPCSQYCTPASPAPALPLPLFPVRTCTRMSLQTLPTTSMRHPHPSRHRASQWHCRAGTYWAVLRQAAAKLQASASP